MLTRIEVEEIKKEVGVDEPPDTCPRINAIQQFLSDAEAELEHLRRHNENLREWGTVWRDKAMLLFEEKRNAKAQIEELESYHRQVNE